MLSLVQNLINNALNASAQSVRVELINNMVCVADDATGNPPSILSGLPSRSIVLTRLEAESLATTVSGSLYARR